MSSLQTTGHYALTRGQQGFREVIRDRTGALTEIQRVMIGRSLR